MSSRAATSELGVAAAAHETDETAAEGAEADDVRGRREAARWREELNSEAGKADSEDESADLAVVHSSNRMAVAADQHNLARGR